MDNSQQIDFKPLPPTFTGRASQKEYDFEQVKREGNVAIFKKVDRTSPDKLTYFEAIHIRVHNGYKMGGVTFPPGERYPSDREFGVYAYCCNTIERAEEKYQEFLTKQNEKNDAQD